MARRSSLKPAFRPERNEKGFASWAVNIPPELSPTGKRRQLYYETESEAATVCEALQNRRDEWMTKPIPERTVKARATLEHEALKAWKAIEHRASLGMLNKLGSVVYLLESGGFLKIGKTSRIAKRLRDYQAHNPGYKLIAVRGFKDMEEAGTFEIGMHRKFSKHRKENEREWFKDLMAIRIAFEKEAKGRLMYLNLLLT